MSSYSPEEGDDLPSDHFIHGFAQSLCISDVQPPDHPSHNIDLSCLGVSSAEDRSQQHMPQAQSTQNSPQVKHLQSDKCGKVRSQGRSHSCTVCNRAFKRHDHLTGHMLTHLKRKPFMCNEEGCNKSYCDARSLKRHNRVHHKTNAIDASHREASEKKELPKTSSIQNKIEETPGSNKDLLSVTGMTADVSVFQGPMTNHMSQTLMLTETTMIKDSTSNAYTLINSSKDIAPESVIYLNPDSQWLDFCPDKALKINPGLPEIHSQHSPLLSVATDSIDDDVVNGQATCSRDFSDLTQTYVSQEDEPVDTLMWLNSDTHLPHAIRTQEATKEPDFTKLTIQPYESSALALESSQPLFQSPTFKVIQIFPDLSIHFETLTSTNLPMRDTRDSDQRDLLVSDANSSYSKEIGCGISSGSRNGQAEQKLIISDPGPKLQKIHRKLTFKRTLPSTVSPSQVALESFSTSHMPESNGRSCRLSISHTLQGENICKVLRVKRKGNMKTRQSPMLPPPLLSDSEGEKASKLFDEEKKQSQPLQNDHERDRENSVQEEVTAPQPLKPSKNNTPAGHLVIPVSVPVYRTDQVATSPQRTATKPVKNKKKRPCNSLYIPQPVRETSYSPSIRFQSNLRSPNVYLSLDLHNVLQHLPYTPPPMLSPIRQGTGLYFNTFCTPSCTSDLALNLPGKEASEDYATQLTKDNSVFAIKPHINIGDRFQAEIPKIRDMTLLEGEEEKADLVWKPWLDKEIVSSFLDLACSSAVPRGGNNLEFALHCLHFTQGDVMKTLNILLTKEPQKYFPPWLSDYHYAGSDHWSAKESRQFKKAYNKRKKNFYYIQSLLPEKTVHQCVEYYYTWKKINVFQRHCSADPSTSIWQNPDGEEDEGSTKDRQSERKEVSCPSQKHAAPRSEHTGHFACQECDRVFDRVKSRNAHMKKHRQQKTPQDPLQKQVPSSDFEVICWTD